MTFESFLLFWADAGIVFTTAAPLLSLNASWLLFPAPWLAAIKTPPMSEPCESSDWIEGSLEATETTENSEVFELTESRRKRSTRSDADTASLWSMLMIFVTFVICAGVSIGVISAEVHALHSTRVRALSPFCPTKNVRGILTGCCVNIRFAKARLPMPTPVFVANNPAFALCEACEFGSWFLLGVEDEVCIGGPDLQQGSLTS